MYNRTRLLRKVIFTIYPNSISNFFLSRVLTGQVPTYCTQSQMITLQNSLVVDHHAGYGGEEDEVLAPGAPPLLPQVPYLVQQVVEREGQRNEQTAFGSRAHPAGGEPAGFPHQSRGRFAHLPEPVDVGRGRSELCLPAQPQQKEDEGGHVQTLVDLGLQWHGVAGKDAGRLRARGADRRGVPPTAGALVRAGTGGQVGATTQVGDEQGQRR